MADYKKDLVVFQNATNKDPLRDGRRSECSKGYIEIYYDTRTERRAWLVEYRQTHNRYSKGHIWWESGRPRICRSVWSTSLFKKNKFGFKSYMDALSAAANQYDFKGAPAEKDRTLLHDMATDDPCNWDCRTMPREAA